MNFLHGDDVVALDARRLPEGQFALRLSDDDERVFLARRLPDNVIEIDDGVSVRRVTVVRGVDGSVAIAENGRVFSFAPVVPGRRTAARSAAASGMRIAPMTGVVAEVAVAEGDTVSMYQKLVVVEAMKVLATVDAPFAGKVASVLVRKGDRVEHGAPLVEITPIDAAGDAIVGKNPSA